MKSPITALLARLQEKLPSVALALLIPVLVTACSSAPSRPSVDSFAPRTLEQQLAKAAQLRYPERASVTLELVQPLIKENPAQAKQALDDLPYDQLPKSLQAKLAVLQAQLAQANNRDWVIFDWLDREAVISSRNRDINGQAYILKALAYGRFGEYQASLDEWLLAALYLREDEKAPHYDSFWKALLHVSPERLTLLYQQERSKSMKGWLSLALIYQTGQSLDAQLTGLEQWKQVWIDHPAREFLPDNFEILKNSSTVRPNRIAVLLPLIGRLEKNGYRHS